MLPLQITFWSLVVLAAMAFAVAPLLRLRRRVVAVAAIPTAAVLFLPLLLGVGEIVDRFRYGIFTYATATEAIDKYVSLPPEATSISVVRYASGHEARFSISEIDLRRWLRTLPPPDPTLTWLGTAQERLHRRIGAHGWAIPTDIEFFPGAVSARGGGQDVYYSPSQQLAFITAAYW